MKSIIGILLFTVVIASAVVAKADYENDGILAQKDANNPDLFDRKLGSYYIAKDEVGTLIVVYDAGETRKTLRFTAYTAKDMQYIQKLKSDAPYNCSFGTIAQVCYADTVAYNRCAVMGYRSLVKDVQCVEIK